MYQNKELLDQINSIGQQSCTQLVNKQLVSLRQMKNRNFLTTQSSKHYKVPEIEKPKSNKKPQDLNQIKYKFEIKDDDYHKVIQKIVRMSQKTHLLPSKLQFKPNHAVNGLSIGRVGEDFTTERETKFPRTRNSEPEDDVFKQLTQARTSQYQTKISTDRSKLRDTKIVQGSTTNFCNQNTSQPLEVVWFGNPENKESRSSPHRTMSQKQFNVYKKRHIATPNLALHFKHRKMEEQEAYRKYMQEQERLLERSFFDLIIFDKQVKYAQEVSYKVEQFQQQVKIYAGQQMKLTKDKCYKQYLNNVDGYVQCVLDSLDTTQKLSNRMRYLGLFMELRFLECMKPKEDEGANHKCIQKLAQELNIQAKQYAV